MLRGIDISKWQDHTPDLTGVDFVIVKATEGLTVDPMFATHVRNVQAHPEILLMAYHYSDKRFSVGAQVGKFLATAPNFDGYALDVEGLYRFSPAQSKYFITGMHDHKKKCGWYSNMSEYQGNVGQDFNWIAYYAKTPPTIPYDIWQFGPDPIIKAATGKTIDGDKYNGTLAQLRALVGAGMDAFTIPAQPQAAVIASGDWIYDNPTLQPSPGNIQVSPGRNMPVAGRLASGVLIVGYVDTTPSESYLRIMYAKSTQKIVPVVTNVQIPPDAVSCKPLTDTAYAKGAADGQTSGEKQGVLAERKRLTSFLGLDVIP